jgi:hypothetical protein
MSDVSIRVKALDGTWETLGSDRHRGMIAESLELASDQWGPSTCTFSIKSLPWHERVDLWPFTAVEVEIDGILCWAGFVWERPSERNEYRVSCRGWQYHLDDDLYSRAYVHTRLSDWKDSRSELSQSLNPSGGFCAAGQVSSDDAGGIILSTPPGTFQQFTKIGVQLDLGPATRPGNYAKRVVIEWEHSAGDSSVHFYMRSGTTPIVPGSGNLVSIAITGTTTGTSAATISPIPHRYLFAFLEYDTTHANGGDIWFKIKSVKVFRETAYESGNVSVLEADEVIRDALTIAPLLNQDTRLIQESSFNIPEYVTAGYKTPRQVIEEVNLYENYQARVTGGDLRTLEYRPKPVSPRFEVGEWSGGEFTDRSVSGEEIFSQAIVEATGPEGSTIVAERGHGHAGNAASLRRFTLTDSWVTSDGDATISLEQTDVTRPLQAGIVYAVRVVSLQTISGGPFSGNALNVTVGDLGVEELNIGNYAIGFAGPGPWFTYKPFLKRTQVGVRATFDITAPAPPHTGRVDLIVEFRWGGTLVERIGVPRAKTIQVRSAATQPVAERFADLWLGEHRTAPFAGTLAGAGGSMVRIHQTGEPVPPQAMLLHVGEKIRLTDQIDPDTGALGRDGRIAAVSYQPRDNRLAIAIDDRRQDFERLLERYGALVA